MQPPGRGQGSCPLSLLHHYTWHPHTQLKTAKPLCFVKARLEVQVPIKADPLSLKDADLAHAVIGNSSIPTGLVSCTVLLNQDKA